jgi:uncharacterized membrane protein
MAAVASLRAEGRFAMPTLPEMRRWPLCLIAAAFACAPPTDTNQAAESNGQTAAATRAAEPADADVALNSAAGPPAPVPPAAKAPVPAPAPIASYTARGQEPGWLLTIAGGRIDYLGNYGETKINVPQPEPQSSANGRRYVTGRLVVDIVYARCNDSMSGHGYEHRVKVTADGESFDGCGGARRTDWDM